MTTIIRRPIAPSTTTGPTAATTADTTAPPAPRAALLATLAVLVTMTFWASSFVAIRYVGTDLSPGPLALIRVAVATVVLAPFVLRRGLAVPHGRGWLLVGGYAALWMALYTVVLNAAEHHLDAGSAAMLVNVAPILVTLWVGFVQRAGFTAPLVAGLAVAFAGVVVIGLGAEGAQRDLTGVLLGLLAAGLYAAGVLLQKGALRTIDPLSATWWGTALGSVALVLYVPSTVAEVAEAPTGAILAAIYMGVFPTAVAFSLWAYALRRVDAARLSLSSYLVPAIAVLLSWALLAEVPTTLGMVGGTLCLVGVAVSRVQGTSPLGRTRTRRQDGGGGGVRMGPAQTKSTTARASEHEAAVGALTEAYRRLPQDQPVRLAKATSNLFRPRAQTAHRLDVSAFTGVISVDPPDHTGTATARVAGMTTYEQLVDELLPHGYLPLVVPQLKTITIGGAVTGLGIEATSFRNGLPHESVRELEILTGTGEVVTATPDGPHADLFRAFPNSYGSLGYAVALVIELEPVRPYVEVRHVRFTHLAEVAGAIGEVMATRRWDGQDVDFVDGVVFSATETYLTLGRWTDRIEGQPAASDYTGQDIYYRSIQHRRRDVLTVRDYLWRWDTDWFWCSRAFGAQHPRIRRLWPKKYLRSDVYWKIVAFEQRHGILAGIDRRRGRPAQERVIQDVEIPLERTAEFLRWFLREVPIEPLWLCPVQLRSSGAIPGVSPGDGPGDGPRDGPETEGSPAGSSPWPLYPMRPGEPYVNVGFWSAVPIRPGAERGDVNRAIEAKVTELDGHKGLYSEAFYDEATFDGLYGGPAYRPVKGRYDPAGRFPTLYEKAVRSR